MPYEPRNLTPDQVRAQYAQVIVHAEAAVHQAWCNLILAETNYAQTTTQLEALEADRARALAVLEPPQP